MDAIFKFFEAIGAAIQAILDFVVKFVQDLIFAIKLLAELAPQLPAWYTWFPPVLWYSFSCCIGLAIVYKIAGREG